MRQLVATSLLLLTASFWRVRAQTQVSLFQKGPPEESEPPYAVPGRHETSTLDVGVWRNTVLPVTRAVLDGNTNRDEAELTFTVLDDVSIKLNAADIFAVPATDQIVWRGENGQRLIVSNRTVYGFVNDPTTGDMIEIRPTTNEEAFERGVLSITQVNMTSFPAEYDLVIEDPEFNETEAGFNLSMDVGQPNAALAADAQKVYVTVLLVLESNHKLCRAGVSKGYIDDYALMFQEQLTAAFNSVQDTTIRAQVFAECVSYSSTRDMQQDLYAIQRNSEINQLRAQYGADLVQLLLDYRLNYCGIGFKPSQASASNRNQGFSVAAQSCHINSYTGAHEIGHNFGMNHDRQAENAWSSSGCNYGYFNTDTCVLSIMAYFSSCPCCRRRSLTFSTPAPFEGRTVGVSCTTAASGGRYLRTNNFLQLAQAAPHVSAYMPQTFPTNEPTGGCVANQEALLTDVSGSLSDGPGRYTQDTDCSWRINPPLSDNQYIKIDFTEFDLDPCCDFVRITNGDGLDVLATEADDVRDSIISRSSDVRVQFRAGSSTPGEGFSLSYAVHDLTQCEAVWSQWGRCSPSCRKSRVWRVLTPGDQCLHEDGFIETVDCSSSECRDCVGSWSGWSSCDDQCRQSRIFQKTQTAIGAGTQCDAQNGATQTRQCAESLCTLQCTASWSDWSACDSQCQQTRKWHVTKPGRNCDFEDGFSQTRTCSASECRDCIGVWSSWSSCNDQCQQSRTFQVAQTAIGAGKQCEAANGVTQTRQCSEDICTVQCTASWSGWSACDSQCQQTRSWQVTKPGRNCEFEDGFQQSQTCSTTECRNCVGSWSSWSTCNDQCQQSRTFQVTEPAIGVGQQCETAEGSVQTRQCPPDTCTVECVASWSAWSTCDSQCQQTRTWQVTKPGRNCQFDDGFAETRACATNECRSCAGSWTDWSQCDSQCQQRRTFVVSQTAIGAGEQCVEQDGTVEARRCPNCIVECVAAWSNFSPCSSDCEKSRVWQVTQPGESCLHENGFVETVQCGTSECADCIGAFGEWSACDPQSCQRARTFRVTQDRVGSGDPCPHNDGFVETEQCPASECATECVGTWSPWTECSREGDRCLRKRQFNVTQPGDVCEASDGEVQTEDCECPVTPAVVKYVRLMAWGWDDASNECEAIGGRLAVIKSPEENLRVAEACIKGITNQLPDQMHGCFIGLYRDRGRSHSTGWQWVDSTSASEGYTEWFDTQPNAPQLVAAAAYILVDTNGTGGEWVDMRRYQLELFPFPAVCELRMCVEGDTSCDEGNMPATLP